MGDEELPRKIRGVDFDYKNKMSCNRLLNAVVENDEQLVQKLLSKGWSANSTDNCGRTAMHLAAKQPQLTTIMKILLDEGDGYVNHMSHSGATPLFEAAKAGAKETLVLLLARGASVNAENCNRETALHYACKGVGHDTVRLLVEAGARVDHEDISGTTPLMQAVKEKRRQTVTYLLESGADVRLRDTYQRTAFHLTCILDDLFTFNLLLELGGLTKEEVGNLTDEDGWTLLMLASQYSANNIVETLLLLGCDTTRKNKDGLLALHLAAHNCDACFASLLKHTPLDVINSTCVYRPGSTGVNSLPCILMDTGHNQGLSLLYNLVGIHSDVLICPIVLTPLCATSYKNHKNDLHSPISFCLHRNMNEESLSSLLDVYLGKGLPPDPDYPVFDSVRRVTCLESLVLCHTEHIHPHQIVQCPFSCARLFVRLVEENAALVDPYIDTPHHDLDQNEPLCYACDTGSVFFLSRILKHSHYLNAEQILIYITSCFRYTSIPITKLLKTTKYLTSQSHSGELAPILERLSETCTDDDVERKTIIEVLSSSLVFPSLLLLSRASLRGYVRTLSTPRTFPAIMASLPLPQHILAFVQHDDILPLLKSNPDYPSFEI